MNRGYRLSESKHGFNARGRLLSSPTALAAIAAWRAAKGFFHPDSDVEIRVFPLDSPALPIGFQDRKYLLSKSKDEELGPKWYHNVLHELVPWRPLSQKWTWSQMREILQSHTQWHHFDFTLQFMKTVRTRIKGKKISYYLTCYIRTRKLTAGSKNLWAIYLRVSDWTDGVEPTDDEQLVGQFSSVAEKWAQLAGLSHLFQVEEDPEQIGGPVWRVKPGKPSGYEGPYLILDAWSERYDIPVPEFVLPGDSEAILPRKTNIGLIDVDLKTAINAFEEAFRPFFGEDPVPEDISFSVLDPELPEFKKLAEPIFGSPWLQDMGTFAQPGYVPQVDDSVPDWSIQPVAYFKILGSWRIIDLLKEPGGWRFIVTGKYTKDPLKHRHIRDELARKAGMTSETLWEPQEVGEGWLGVPG